MTRGRVSIVIASAFAAGFATASTARPPGAQGTLRELKRVDLGSWAKVLLFRILQKGQPPTTRVQ